MKITYQMIKDFEEADRMQSRRSCSRHPHVGTAPTGRNCKACDAERGPDLVFFDEADRLPAGGTFSNKPANWVFPPFTTLRTWDTRPKKWDGFR